MVPYEDPEELGRAIRRARQLAGWPQKRLAYEAGVSDGTVKRWEAGSEQSLGNTLPKRRALAIVVGVLTGQPEVTLGDHAAELLSQASEEIERSAQVSADGSGDEVQKLKASQTKQAVELARARSQIEGLHRRLERLERRLESGGR